MIILQGQGGIIEYVPPRRAQAVPIAGLLRVTKTTTPPAITDWRMSRMQLVRLGLRMLWASIQR